MSIRVALGVGAKLLSRGPGLQRETPVSYWIQSKGQQPEGTLGTCRGTSFSFLLQGKT